MTVFLYSVLLGFCWRAGGGLINIKGNGVIFRCIFPSLILGSFFDLTWPFYIALIPCFYIGEMVGYSKHWWLGRKDYTFWHDFAYLTLRGVLFTALAGVVVGYATDWTNGVIVGLSGGVMGGAYALGWSLPALGQEFGKGPEQSEFWFMFLTGLIAMGGSWLIWN